MEMEYAKSVPKDRSLRFFWDTGCVILYKESRGEANAENNNRARQKRKDRPNIR